MKLAALLLLSSLVRVLGEIEMQDPVAASADRPETKTYLRQEQSNRELGVYTVRVMVKYSNKEGKDAALALSSRLYHDFRKRSVLSIEIEEKALKELTENPNIELIEEDRIYVEQGYHERTLTEEEMEHRRLQTEKTPYGISMVQADQLTVGSNPVKVCVADTGTARSHPDLPSWLLSGANRYSSISGAPLYWSVDARGHGTHVTGTINARDNTIGVRGIGNIPVYVTRALDDNGQARESDIYAAVEQCGNSGAKVISMSLGGSGMSQTFKDMLTNLYDKKGILLVAASGNNGASSVSWPAAHPRVIAVGAVDDTKALWSGSNYGSGMELTAPGKMILSTTVNSVGQYIYSFYTGTSMATPHVAGVAALVWSHFPLCTNTQIRYALAVTALDAGAAGCDNYFGRGIVQARAAYNWLASRPCATASWGRNSSPQGGCSSL